MTGAAAWLHTEVCRLTAEWHPNAARVTRALALSAPTVGRAVTIVAGFGSVQTSMWSRYTRAGLPSPKRQLVLFRLTLAVTMRARGASTLADIGLALDHSSPQSFNRHLRQQTGRRASAFLEHCQPGPFWAEAVSPVLRWDDERWVFFDPLAGGRRRRSDLASLSLWGLILPHDLAPSLLPKGITAP